MWWEYGGANSKMSWNGTLWAVPIRFYFYPCKQCFTFRDIFCSSSHLYLLFELSAMQNTVTCDRQWPSMGISIEEKTRCIVMKSVLGLRGGARNFPTEGLELPTGGLKWLKMVFPCAILPNFLRREPKISSDGGGGGGAVAPPSPPLAPPLLGLITSLY